MTYKIVTISSTTMKSAFFAYLIGKRNPFAGEKSLFLGWQWHRKAGVESNSILEVYSVFPVISLRFPYETVLSGFFIGLKKIYHYGDKKLSQA